LVPKRRSPIEKPCRTASGWPSVDDGRGERDYRDVFAEPLPCVLAAPHGSCIVDELDRNCPRPRSKQAASGASNVIEGKWVVRRPFKELPLTAESSRVTKSRSSSNGVDKRQMRVSRLGTDGSLPPDYQVFGELRDFRSPLRAAASGAASG
jgi:hypothetical protein